MASLIGMHRRNDTARQRIDAAIGRLAEGASLPEQPAPTRDAVLNDTQRAEWLADVLETIAGGEAEEDRGADLFAMTRDDLNAYAEEIGIQYPNTYRTKGDLVDAIVARGEG